MAVELSPHVIWLVLANRDPQLRGTPYRAAPHAPSRRNQGGLPPEGSIYTIKAAVAEKFCPSDTGLLLIKTKAMALFAMAF